MPDMTKWPKAEVEVARAREEQREADARAAQEWADAADHPCGDVGDAVRATPLTATPLTDEVARLREERDETRESLKLARESLRLHMANGEHWEEQCRTLGKERDEALAAHAALREALEAAARSLESVADRNKTEDEELRAYALSRSFVARAALATDGGKPRALSSEPLLAAHRMWQQALGLEEGPMSPAAVAGAVREFARKCVKAGVCLGLPESTGPRTLEEVVEEVCK